MDALPRFWPRYTVTPSDLSRLRSTFSSSPLRTDTLRPAPSDTSARGIGRAELFGVRQGQIDQFFKLAAGVLETGERGVGRA